MLKKTKSIIKNNCERSKNFIQTQSLSNLRRKVGYTFLFLINFYYNKKQRWPKDFLIALMKKVCLEKKLSIKDINEEIDISEHEVEKFLLIFHLLMETVNSEESLDNNDGIVSDTILKIVLKISQLLKNNIDWLKIPEIFKIALKKIKSLFNLQTDQNAEHTGEREMGWEWRT